MLTMLEVFNARGENLALPLEDTQNGYSVRGIDGLGPVKASISSSKFADLQGEQFQASRSSLRNVVIKLGLEPDYVATTVSELRTKLYDWFLPRSNVTLKFYIDNEAFVEIDGIVETCEPEIFSDRPEMTISILCMEPDFLSVTESTVSGVTTGGNNELTIDYPSPASTGFIFELNVNRSMSSLQLVNRTSTDERLSLSIVYNLLAGDTLRLVTVPGQKSATLLRAGVPINVLNSVAPSSTWFALSRGPNHIRAAVTGLGIPYTITYRTRYGGL